MSSHTAMLKTKHDPEYLSTTSPKFRSVIYGWPESGENWCNYTFANGTAFTGYAEHSALVAKPPGLAASGVPSGMTAPTTSQPYLVIMNANTTGEHVFAADDNWVKKRT